jgi:hypothetical protein
MKYDKKKYLEEFEKLLNKSAKGKFYIKRSSASFKIDKFLEKGKHSFNLAKFIMHSNEKAKDY